AASDGASIANANAAARATPAINRPASTRDMAGKETMPGKPPRHVGMQLPSPDYVAGAGELRGRLRGRRGRTRWRRGSATGERQRDGPDDGQPAGDQGDDLAAVPVQLVDAERERVVDR